MFVKRLSAALCILLSSGFVLGANPRIIHNVNNSIVESEVLAPQDLSFNLLPISPKCLGENTGSIEVQVIAGSGAAPYSYRYQKTGGAIIGPFNNMPASFTITNLSNGDYTVILTDANGLTEQSKTTIINNPSIQLELESNVIDPACSSGTTSIMLNAVGGSGSPYTYTLYKNGSLVNTNTNGDFLNQGSGTYSATVSDKGGCIKSYNSTINISVPDPINVSFNLLSEINCFNSKASVQIINLPSDKANLNIEVKNTNLNKTYTFIGDYIYNSLDAGNYTITVSRKNCPTDIDTENFEIKPFEQVVVQTIPASPVILNCGGVNDLTTVSFTVSGGKPGNQVKVVMDNDNGNLNDDPIAVINYGETQSFPNLPAGRYTLKWSDVLNPSCYGSQEYVISNPSSPFEWSKTGEAVSITPPNCNGGTDGRMQLNVSGGTLPYTYYVDGTVVTSPISKGAGTYIVYAKDNKGCTTSEKTVTIVAPDPLVVSYDQSKDKDVTCPGANNGEFQISISGGSGIYTYSLANPLNPTLRVDRPATANAVIGQLAGNDNYTITVKDNKNCVSAPISGIEIKEPTPISISVFDVDQINCFGQKGALTVQAFGGADPIMNYKLFKGATEINTISTTGTATFDNLEPAANYKISVTSGSICTDFVERNFVIETKRELLVNPIGQVTLDCPGNTPSVSLTILSGESPYKYSIQDGNEVSFTGNNVVVNSGLFASIAGYDNKITLIDNYGCKKDVSVTIFEPEPMIVNLIDVFDETCKSKNDGSIIVNVSGGTLGKYTLELLESNTTNVVKKIETFTPTNVVFANVPTGLYDLRVADVKLCKATNPPTQIQIDEPDADLLIEDPTFETLKCFGDSTLVTFNVSGGWEYSPKTIKIVQGTINRTISSGSSIYLKYGTYTLNASNDIGCTAPQRQFSIDQPNELTVTATPKNASCFGSNDASIAINVGGGVNGTFKYGLLGLGSADVEFTNRNYTITGNLPSGTYNVVVQDANGCQAQPLDNFTKKPISTVISEPTKVEFDVSVDEAKCYNDKNGVITILNAKGGNDTNYKTFLNGTLYTQSQLSTLAAGTYKVHIEDSKGCKSEVIDTVVYQPTEIIPGSINVIDSVSCYNFENAKLEVSANGGQPYSLRYSLIGTNYLTNRTITIDNGANQVFDKIPPGNYQVEVRNEKNNCRKFFPQRVELKNPNAITVATPTITDVSCFNLSNGEARLVANGGTGTLTYSITNVTTFDSPNISGIFRNLGEKNKTVSSYNYKIEDIKGCNITGIFTIKNPNEILMTYDSHEQVSCNAKKDGWIKVKVSGGNSGYKFRQDLGATSNAEFDFTPSNTYTIKGYGGGTYTPVVVDSKNCTDTLSSPVPIYEPDPIRIVDVVWGKKKCNGDLNEKTVISVNGGTPEYYYSIDNGATWSAKNDSVFVGVSIGYKYPIVKDKFSCQASGNEFLMQEPELFTVTSTFYDIECSDDKYGDMKLDFTGGTGPYTLSINDQTFSSETYNIIKANKDTTSFKLMENDILLLPDLTYKFYVHDNNQCHAQNIPGVNNIIKPVSEKLFKIPDELWLNDLAPKPVTCSNDNTGVINFTPEGGTIYFDNGYTLTATNMVTNITKENSPGILQVSGLFAGLYKIVLKDGNGCIGKYKNGIDTVRVDAKNESIKIEVSDIEQPLCNKVYNGWIEINAYDFLEEGVSFIVERWDSVLNRYTVEDKSWQGVIDADPDYFTGDEDHRTYFFNGKKIVKNLGIGRYQITLIDNYSKCSTSIDTLITSVDGDVCPPLKYYNAFTPNNNDGAYDTWTIYGSEYQNYTLQVFTSFGEMVYSDKGRSSGDGIKWDGLDLKKRPLPVGTYIYLLRKYEGTPQDTIINGNITILRGNGR